MKFAILLFDEEEVGGIRGFRNANRPLTQMFFDEFVNLGLFLEIQWE